MLWLLPAIALAGPTTDVKIVVAPAESMHVEITGKGQAVVLIPGLFGSAFGFRKIVPLLVTDGYQTVVIEPLGIGGSSRPKKSSYSLTSQADRIGAVLDSLGIKQAVIVAHSIAGSVGFRLAYRRPELVRALVSLEGGIAESATSANFRLAMRFAPLLKLINGVELVKGQVYRMLMDASGDTTWITDAVIQGYTADASRQFGATLDAYRAMSKAIEPESLHPNLRRIRSPVLLLFGTARHDGGVGGDDTKLLKAALPSFVADSIIGAGHFLHEERPDVVFTAIRRTLRATAASR